MPLLDPDQYKLRGVPARTFWTEKGLESSFRKDYQIAQDKSGIAIPGKHFKVLPASDGAYTLFPSNVAGVERMQDSEVTDLVHFRHSWVLERKQRPDVVVISGQRLPYPSTPEPERSQYYNLFFRPWTLFVGDADVPHIRLLSLERDAVEQYYAAEFHGIAVESRNAVVSTSWKAAWENYVRGNVVSAAAAKLIEAFLRETSYGKEVDAEELAENAVQSAYKQDMPQLHVSAVSFQDELVNVELETKKRKTAQDMNFIKSNEISIALSA